MLDSWSTENLIVYGTTKESPIALTPGTATVTLGVGGNITTRPMSINAALIKDANSGAEYPVRLVSLAEYASNPVKTVQSNYPQDLYDDGGYPQRTLTLYPIPSAANYLVLYTDRPLTNIATLDTAISLPPGYERALVYNGAIEIAAEYGREPSQAVVKVAMESKDSIKRANYKPEYLTINDIPAQQKSRFNIFKGDYN